MVELPIKKNTGNRSMKEGNNSNKSTEGTGLFFAWKMAKLAFDKEQDL